MGRALRETVLTIIVFLILFHYSALILNDNISLEGPWSYGVDHTLKSRGKTLGAKNILP